MNLNLSFFQGDILVLGAGVSGLSTGILLLKNGYRVTIWAKDIPPDTTSNKAAAVWYPYLGYPKKKVFSWARYTLSYLRKEILPHLASGCIDRTITELYEKSQRSNGLQTIPEINFQKISQNSLPERYVGGYRINSIVIDTSIYMNHLITLFKSMGGVIFQREINNISEALSEYNIIVNCTGLGSRMLFHDNRIYPVRGQMVKIKANGLDEVIVVNEGFSNLVLAVPRGHDIMLGGTNQKNDWNTEVSCTDTQEILRKVALLSPKLRTVEILGESVGLRPVRDTIRLESERFMDKTIVHNYGHGGSGFTVSWGCAQEVVSIVQAL